MGNKKSEHLGGRPTKWTKQNRDAIILNLENGATHKRSAILAGIGESTFSMWKKQGFNDQEEGLNTDYTEFLDRIAEAEEKYIAWLQQSVNRDAEHDGRLALDVLSRKRPDEFGKKDNISIENFNIEYKLPPELQKIIDDNKDE